MGDDDNLKREMLYMEEDVLYMVTVFVIISVEGFESFYGESC